MVRGSAPLVGEAVLISNVCVFMAVGGWGKPRIQNIFQSDSFSNHARLSVGVILLKDV